MPWYSLHEGERGGREGFRERGEGGREGREEMRFKCTQQEVNFHLALLTVLPHSVVGRRG